MSKRQQAAAVLNRTGSLRVLQMGWGAQSLTVLGHHRITDPHAPDFYGDPALVSATPELFAWQLDYLADRYTVISLQACRDFIVDGVPLPPRPLLITFDDGYLDNYTTAYPMLKERGLPAVIFLATSRMDEPTRPLWWDRLYADFARATVPAAALPLIGQVPLGTPSQKQQARLALIQQLKQQPEAAKQAALAEAAAQLGTADPPALPPQFANWHQVRTMVADGIACQPHTHTHPILSRVGPGQVREELRTSWGRIQAETDQPLLGFAYPNGGPGDYNHDVRAALQEIGCPLAFSLMPGPVRQQTAREHPYEIPRVYLNWRDTPELFQTKLAGLPILQQRQRFLLG